VICKAWHNLEVKKLIVRSKEVDR